MKRKLLSVIAAGAISMCCAASPFGLPRDTGTFRIKAATVREGLEETPPVSHEEVSPEEEASRGALSDLAFESRFRAGKYVVGDDLPEGEYMLFAYGEKSSVRIGVQHENSYSVYADPVYYNRIVVFEKGRNVTLDNCYAIPINLVRSGMLKLSGPGMYKAGMHLAPGSYTLVPAKDSASTPSDTGSTDSTSVASVAGSTDSTSVASAAGSTDSTSVASAAGSYTIYSTLTPQTVYQSGDVTSSVQIRLSEGQYLLLQDCCFSTEPSPVLLTYKDKDTVLRVQGQLNTLKYDCGTPDGLLGGRTTTAITRYQEDHKLTVNGKITSELILSLDTECPYAEVESELGPFMMETAEFVSRYNNAAHELSAVENEAYADVTAEDIKNGSCRPNAKGSYAFETNRAADKIRSAFYVHPETYDRRSVQELSLLMYASDPDFKDYASANEAALKLLFDGSQKTASLSSEMFKISESTAAWIQPLS